VVEGAGLFEGGVAAGGALVPVAVLPKRVIKSARLRLMVPEPRVVTTFPEASTAFPEASRVVDAFVVGGRIVLVVPAPVVPVAAVVAAAPVVPKVGVVPEYPPHRFPNCELIPLVSTPTFPRYEPLYPPVLRPPVPRFPAACVLAAVPVFDTKLKFVQTPAPLNAHPLQAAGTDPQTPPFGSVITPVIFGAYPHVDGTAAPWGSRTVPSVQRTE
jgi:hypothetical protein